MKYLVIIPGEGLNISNNIKDLIINGESYDVTNDGSILGLIDWEIDKSNFLKKVVLYPNDSIDNDLKNLYIRNSSKIKFEKDGLLEFFFDSYDDLCEDLSDFQSFSFSSFLKKSGKIKGFVFDISNYTFSINSLLIQE